MPMRVVSCNSFGPVDQLVLEEQPSAPLGAGAVRIRVTACGVNFVDALIVQGLYQLKPVLPFVLNIMFIQIRAAVVFGGDGQGRNQAIGVEVLDAFHALAHLLRG